MYYDLSSFYNSISRLGKKEKIQFLRTCISTSSDIFLRKFSLKLLSFYFNQSEGFRFFKNILLSDEDIEMRIGAGSILRKKYNTNKEIASLFSFILQNAHSLKIKIFALRNLCKINNKESRILVLDYIRKIANKIPKKNNSKIKRKIASLNENYILSDYYKEIFLNLLIYDYYVSENHYHAIIKAGYIVLLNFEGGGIDSVSSLPGISSLKRLEYLNLQRNCIRNMCGFSRLSMLRSLDLSYNNINLIENVDKLLNLEELILSNNKIQHIPSFPKLPKLKKLFLNENEIEKIQCLRQLSILEDLNLGKNKILKIEGLSSLKELKKLNLSFNKISKIEGLDQLSNLIWLHLNDNFIRKVENLDNLFNLKTLYLSNNHIETIQNLQRLKNLIKLEISKNKIKKIQGLEHLRSLQELYLDDNIIDRIEGINTLENLIILFLKGNRIQEFNEKLLEGLKNLNFIFLNENPLNEESKNQYLKRTRFP